jgi:hypothetical protein
MVSASEVAMKIDNMASLLIHCLASEVPVLEISLVIQDMKLLSIWMPLAGDSSRRIMHSQP